MLIVWQYKNAISYVVLLYFIAGGRRGVWVVLYLLLLCQTSHKNGISRWNVSWPKTDTTHYHVHCTVRISSQRSFNQRFSWDLLKGMAPGCLNRPLRYESHVWSTDNIRDPVQKLDIILSNIKKNFSSSVLNLPFVFISQWYGDRVFVYVELSEEKKGCISI